MAKLRISVLLGILIGLQGCPEPPIPEQVLGAAAAQGPFTAGEPFKLVLDNKGAPDPKALEGASYAWSVSGPCEPQLTVVGKAARAVELKVARSCGPERIEVVCEIRRGQKQQTVSQVVQVSPLKAVFGVQPSRPQPPPSTWRVLDDFAAFPDGEKTTLGTKLRVWNFDNAECTATLGSEPRTLRFSGKLPRKSSTCGLAIPLLEDEKGDMLGGDLGKARQVTIVVRAVNPPAEVPTAAAAEVPFQFEITEYDKLAAYGQGLTRASPIKRATPDGWRRHQTSLKKLLDKLPRDSVRSVGLVIKREDVGRDEFALELDLLALTP